MNHIIHVLAETSYHGELTNLKCFHRYSTLKRGEGSFVALLEKWENLRFRKRSINSPMRNFFLKSRNQKAVSKKMEKQVTFQVLSQIKQMTRILRNTKTTCLCQAVVLGNRLLHLLFWVSAFKLIIQFLTSSPKRAFCFLITVELQYGIIRRR